MQKGGYATRGREENYLRETDCLGGVNNNLIDFRAGFL